MFIVFPLLLGVIQGLAEFLPVSSSGHLALFQDFFGFGLSDYDDVTALNVLLHIGTLVAVFIVYRKEIFRMIPAFFTMVKKLFSFGKKYKLEDYTVDERMDMMLIIGTLPLVVTYLLDLLLDATVGFSPVDFMEDNIAKQPIAVGAILILNGFLLFFSDNIGKAERPFENFRLRNAVSVGIFQVFALLPGLSRSGMTITGSRFNSLSKEDSVRFSFLLSIPAICGSCVTELPEFFSNESLESADWMVFLNATVVACIVGLLAMKLLKYISEHSTFRSFSYYCWAVGAAAVIGGIVLLF